jgi:predicted N-formylglutamate amidohydrolase
MMAPVLLSPDEPKPFGLEGRGGRSPFVIVCDHAGRLLPRSLGTLGLSEEDLSRHIAWDIGAGAVARRLAGALDGCVVWQRYSRLAIDCNRPLGSIDSIVSRSERTVIPGNLNVASADAVARAKEIFEPYHTAIRRALDYQEAVGRPTILIAMHTFTPTFHDVGRPWHAGVLYNRDSRLAKKVLPLLRREGDLIVGENEPYSASAISDFSIVHHAERRGIPYVELEVRQDLVAEEAGQRAWAERLARILTAAGRAFQMTPTR